MRPSRTAGHGRARPREGLERNWKGKRVVIVGLARQGKALARYLGAKGARVIVTDQKPADELTSAVDELADYPIHFELGGHPESLMHHAHALFLSGGVPADIPLAVQARQSGIPVLNDAQVFVEGTRATTVGISGSAGKSTTTALVGEIGRLALQDSPARIWVGGNIGRPLLLDLDQMRPEDVAVLELSSFQLELMTAGVDIAALLNLIPDHLDRHGSLEAYQRAKARLLNYQPPGGAAVLNRDDPAVWELRGQTRARLAAFSMARAVEEGAFLKGGEIRLRRSGQEIGLIPVEEVRLPGAHNYQNALAAAAISAQLGWPSKAIREGLAGFQGLPHRLELVAEIDGVRWINDSIATTPGRAAAGIRAVPGDLVLLLGGRDKGLDWTPVIEAARGRARSVLLFGEAAQVVERHFREAGFEAAPLELFVRLREAVERAQKSAVEGQAVLLSPGGTSFDEFQDFEARGEAFRRMVRD